MILHTACFVFGVLLDGLNCKGFPPALLSEYSNIPFDL
jgi:hypothetical protein